MKVLLIGCGDMANEYFKVLKSINIEVDVVGRSKKSAKRFEVKNNHLVVSLNLKKYLKESKNSNISHAIVATNIENLYNICIQLLNSSISNILLEKPGFLYYKDLLDLNNKSKNLKSNIYIAYNRRFYTSVFRAKEIIKNDGGVKSCFFDFTEWSHIIKNLSIDSKVKNNWFLANSSHIVDLVFHLIGTPKKIYNITTGSLSWHKSSSIFVGSGITKKNILFSYHSNWLGPGRWKIELVTDKNKLILCPIENLKIIKLGSTTINQVRIENDIDINYKPGLFKQVNSFLKLDESILCTLNEQVLNTKFYKKISNYE